MRVVPTDGRAWLHFAPVMQMLLASKSSKSCILLSVIEQLRKYSIHVCIDTHDLRGFICISILCTTFPPTFFCLEMLRKGSFISGSGLPLCAYLSVRTSLTKTTLVLINQHHAAAIGGRPLYFFERLNAYYIINY